MLAPGSTGDEGRGPRPLPATAPRPGLIPVHWSEPSNRLELEPPDLLALALRAQATAIREPRLRPAAPALAGVGLELPAVGLGPPSARPVAEAPAWLLLLIAGPLAGGRRRRPACGASGTARPQPR